MEEFEAENRALTKLNRFVGRISALMNPLTYLIINIATVFLIQKAAIRVNLGALPQGQVVALYNYMLQIIVELIKLASLIITLNKSLACAKRTSAILGIQPDMEYPFFPKPKSERLLGKRPQWSSGMYPLPTKAPVRPVSPRSASRQKKDRPWGSSAAPEAAKAPWSI